MNGEVRKPWWAWGCRAEMTATDIRNLGRFNLWLLIWAVGHVAVSWALSRGAVPPGPAGYALAAGPVALGVAAVVSFVVFLRAADELLRKVHLDALAIGFGTGVVFMNGYRLLERAGAPKLDVADPILPMLVAWVVAQVWGLRRYR